MILSALAAIAQPLAEGLLFQIVHHAIPEMTATSTENDTATTSER
jgi:hypothetical protein